MNADADDRPLLLLDIDGVLQPAGSAVPPGFERLEFADSVVVLNRVGSDRFGLPNQGPVIVRSTRLVTATGDGRPTK